MARDPGRQRAFLRALFAVAGVLVVYVVWPFAGAFFAACVLAAVLSPLQERLCERLGGRRPLAAALLTAGGVTALALPLALVGMLLVRQAEDALDWTSRTLAREGTAGLVEPLPRPLQGVVRRALLALPAGVLDAAALESGALAEEIESEEERREEEGEPPAETMTPSIGASVAAVRDVLSTLGGVIVHTGVLLVATFFLLSQGHRLVAYLIDLTPMEEGRAREMLASFRDVVVGVFLSTFVTAIAQTAVAAAAFVAAGLPGLTLMLCFVFVASFVPAVGGGGAVALIGVYVMLSGRLGTGAFVLLWGLVVVGMVDNFVKPLVARGRAQMATAVVFFAMICGIAAFGPMGLVAGPLIVAFFQTTARMLREETEGEEPRARSRRAASVR